MHGFFSSSEKMHLYSLANSSGHFIKLVNPSAAEFTHSRKYLGSLAIYLSIFRHFFFYEISPTDYICRHIFLSLAKPSLTSTRLGQDREAGNGLLFTCRMPGTSVSCATVRTKRKKVLYIPVPVDLSTTVTGSAGMIFQRFHRFCISFGRNWSGTLQHSISY
jgi:hypothetical protein